MRRKLRGAYHMEEIRDDKEKWWNGEMVTQGSFLNDDGHVLNDENVER